MTSKPNKLWWAALVPLVLIAVGVTIAVMARRHVDAPDLTDRSVTLLADPSDAVDVRLMVALSQAKNFHHKAKVYMADGKPTEAITAVREILALSFPPGAAEAEDVRNDARALLGKLLVGQGELEDAMRVVREGIAGSQRDSFFVANLYTVEGEIHEALAARADANGDGGRAKAIDERHLAIAAYDRSNQIDLALQRELTGAP